MKNRDRKIVVAGCFSWVLMLAALFFLILAIREYAPFYLNDRKMEQLQKDVAPIKKTEEKKKMVKKIPGWASREIDWKKLHKINPDIIAWIQVPETKIDYPVLRCHTWNEYLHKDYKGNKAYLGSVFIQSENAPNFRDFDTIIYGHNMRNKSMFGSLHKYEKKSFWKKHRVIYLYQPDKAIRYRIYAAYDCKDGSETFQTEFKDDAAKKEWILLTRKLSYYTAKDKIRPDDFILTLSTCSNGGPRSSRYVVHSIKKEMIEFDK